MRLSFIFAVHNHQPVGNFDHVFAEAYDWAYAPFLTFLDRTELLRTCLHFSGGLLEWIKANRPKAFDLLARLVQRGQVELLTGGFYEPILSILPDWDKIGQVQRLNAYLASHFGCVPTGMWLAERVWEPHLAKPLAEAGVRYVLLDDFHFGTAGLDVETLNGYYHTEELGYGLCVFPISQRLRYLIPFAPPDQVVEFLRRLAEQGRRLAVIGDDGEKFGVWPGTYRTVYEEKWLDRFVEALAQGGDWCEFVTCSEYMQRISAEGPIYIPTASYKEMGEWALPAQAAIRFEDILEELQTRPGGSRALSFLRGGFWRNFLVKYPEAADIYRKMLRQSRRVHHALALSPHSQELLRAQTAVWRAQGNDVYWHGIFGGLYHPHLRRAARSSLLEADTLLTRGEEPGPDWLRWETKSLDGGRGQELRISTGHLDLGFRTEGGVLFDLGFRPSGLNLADVLARRREAYHRKVDGSPVEGEHGQTGTIHGRVRAREGGLETFLLFDRHRRGCFQDRLWGPGVDPAQVRLGRDTELADLVGAPYSLIVEGEEGKHVHATFSDKNVWLPSGRFDLFKAIRVQRGRAAVNADYTLLWQGPLLPVTFGVEFNLAFTAGRAPGRFLRLPGVVLDDPSFEGIGVEGGIPWAELADEWGGVRARLSWTEDGSLWWYPVYTVTLSEAGFEKIFQGICLIISWQVLLADAPWSVSVTCELFEEGVVRDDR